MKEDAEGTPTRRLTMDGLAQLAGVHKSTVSRALRPGTTFYRSETAQRIRAIAGSMDFQLDRNAASLRTRRTRTFGVLVPRLSDNLQAVFYEAVVRACEVHDYFALVAVTGDNPESERHAGNVLLGRRVDGLILTSARINGDYPRQLKDRDIPFVLAIRHADGYASVVSDDAGGGRLATQHLIKLGHRRIGLVAGPDDASSSLGRRRGFYEAHQQADLKIDEKLVRESRFRWQDGYDIALEWLKSDDPPTAIFAVNDETAFGVVAAAQTLGLRLPQDLSVAGYGDIPSAARPPLPLTTIRMDITRLADATVELLYARLEGKTRENRTIPVSLVVRESTAPPTQRITGT